MSKGPRIKPTVKRVIVWEAVKDRNKPRRQMMVELQNIIERMGEIVPAEETLERLISQARNHTKSPLDEPFSLASLAEAEYDIPPDSTSDLLAVWKYCLAIGHEFTVREAKWVTRLRTVIRQEHRRIGTLFAYAFEYAIREKVSAILRSPMDTRDIDGHLSASDFTHDDWDYTVFRAVNIVPRFTLNYRDRDHLLPQGDRSRDYFAGQAASGVAWDSMPLRTRKDIGTLNPITGYSSGLSEAEDRACAALLLYLSKGSLWNTLSEKEYLAVLDYVKEVVTKEMPSVRRITYENLDHSSYSDRPNGLTPEDVISADVLKRVGYEVTTHFETVDNPYPNLKDYRETIHRATYIPPEKKEAQNERAHS